VLDVGCGTGTLACLLAQRGIEVVGTRPGGGVARCRSMSLDESLARTGWAGSMATRRAPRRSASIWW
jgi:SAM-dependent methyltransferase